MNVFIAIVAGFIHGINEGMDMHHPNVRNHRWFWLYHRLGVVEIAALLWLGHRLFIGWWLIPAAILANRFAEMGYGIARYKNPFPGYENVLGTKFVVKGKFADIFRILLISAGIIALFIN